MFRTLRTKLILAFLSAGVLTVVLTGVGSFLLLQHKIVDAERERIGALVLPVWLEVNWLSSTRATPEQIRSYLAQRAEEWNVRFLLVDAADTIVVDTQNGQLVGERFERIQASLTFSEAGARGFSFGSIEQGKEIVFTTPRGPRSVTESVQRQYDLYMPVPEDAISGAWKQLLPRLGLPALVALAVAGVIAYLLARSIARPVARVTHASEAMSRGQYDQQIPVAGRDEIGRLAAAFNEMARQVSRSHQMMRDLLANVAHELKTPLTSIQGFSQALQDGTARTPEDQARAARIISDEAERMRRLIEDLLYLSQLESGQLRMEMGAVEPSMLLSNAAERVTWQVRDSGRTLRVSVAPDLPALTGDERRLEQVLANLLENAVRHTPEGGTISLRGERDAAHVILAVHNSGSYIPPEVLPRIFERFYRADRARARDGRHGGLGLSIAQEIVAAHHGRIEAASDPESGTEFRVLLPLPVAVAAQEPSRGGGLAGRLPLSARRSA